MSELNEEYQIRKVVNGVPGEWETFIRKDAGTTEPDLPPVQEPEPTPTPEPIPAPIPTPEPAPSADNILFAEDFNKEPFMTAARIQAIAAHAFQIVDDPTGRPVKVARFELRNTDPEASGGTRAELLYPEESAGRERWYAFRAYYPSADYQKDSNNDILNQWHQGSGTGSPSTTFRVRHDRLLLRTGNTVETRQEFDLGVQTKDVWHEFVFHMIHSNGADGLIEVWHNGKQVLIHQGGNMYAAPLPRWKVGIYKDDWNGTETTDTTIRVFYLDQVRMGNEKATLQDMTSGLLPEATETPTVPEASLQVTGFSLINSGTELPIMPLADNAVLSLQALPSTKLNIQAHTIPEQVGSVKLELSGASEKTYIDDTAPYALHGDSGSGNFYYGNWNPPALGAYTLTATPYAGKRGEGEAGKPYTIHFTIVK